MKTLGIRVSDKVDNIVSVELPEILSEINRGHDYFWAILFLNAIGNLGSARPMLSFEKEINNSPRGIKFTWDEILTLSKKFEDLMDITLIGCKNEQLIQRYFTEKEMRENCDIVIEMIDSSYWEIFSKDKELINRLSIKFKNIKYIDTSLEKMN